MSIPRYRPIRSIHMLSYYVRDILHKIALEMILSITYMTCTSIHAYHAPRIVLSTACLRESTADGRAIPASWTVYGNGEWA